jgi:hypothetical protein
MKKLTIKPNGMISGGHLEYSVNDQTGVIKFTGEITVHMLFFSKTFPLNGQVQVDPHLILSAQVKPGLSYHSGPVKIDVISLHDHNKAVANVSIKNDTVDAGGGITLDLSAKDISIVSGNLSGTVQGHNVQLQLV